MYNVHKCGIILMLVRSENESIAGKVGEEREENASGIVLVEEAEEGATKYGYVYGDASLSKSQFL